MRTDRWSICTSASCPNVFCLLYSGCAICQRSLSVTGGQDKRPTYVFSLFLLCFWSCFLFCHAMIWVDWLMTADDGGNVSKHLWGESVRENQSLCVASLFIKCTCMHIPVNLKPFVVFVREVVTQGWPNINHSSPSFTSQSHSQDDFYRALYNIYLFI